MQDGHLCCQPLLFLWPHSGSITFLILELPLLRSKITDIQYVSYFATQSENSQNQSAGLPYCRIYRQIPVSSEISDLFLFCSYFASLNKEIKSGIYIFDVCCVN